MLDWPHRSVLRAVAEGDTDASPALDDLVAAGLVQRTGDALEVTSAGHAALAASDGPLEVWGWRLVAGGLAVYALASLGERIWG